MIREKQRDAARQAAADKAAQLAQQRDAARQARDAARQAQDAARQAAAAKTASDAADKVSTTYLNASLAIGNTGMGYAFFRGAVIADDKCIVRIDQDVYDAAGAQTKTLTKRAIVKACGVAYEHAARKITDPVAVRVINLADEEVYWDVLSHE